MKKTKQPKINKWAIKHGHRIIDFYDSEQAALNILRELGGAPYKVVPLKSPIKDESKTRGINPQTKGMYKEILIRSRINQQPYFVYKHMKYSRSNRNGTPLPGYTRRVRCSLKIFKRRMADAEKRHADLCKKYLKLESSKENPEF